MRYTAIALGLLLFASCKTDGVEKNKEPETQPVVEQERVDTLEMDLAVADKKTLQSGLSISWLKKGTGEALQQGDVVMIDYKVRLEDSSIVDGNHLLNKDALPFMVGFKMQTEGWEQLMGELHVGDFVRVYMPAKLARGDKEAKGLIPKNADNYITLRVLRKEKPTRVVDGNKVWLFEENKKSKKKFNENNRIIFHAMISTPTKPLYFNSFATNEPFDLRLEDQGLVPGLKKALINAKKGDRMFILVPAQEAYGSKGYLDVVKPNQDLFYNVMVMDVLDK